MSDPFTTRRKAPKQTSGWPLAIVIAVLCGLWSLATAFGKGSLSPDLSFTLGYLLGGAIIIFLVGLAAHWLIGKMARVYLTSGMVLAILGGAVTAPVLMAALVSVGAFNAMAAAPEVNEIDRKLNARIKAADVAIEQTTATLNPATLLGKGLARDPGADKALAGIKAMQQAQVDYRAALRSAVQAAHDDIDKSSLSASQRKAQHASLDNNLNRFDDIRQRMWEANDGTLSAAYSAAELLHARRGRWQFRNGGLVFDSDTDLFRYDLMIKDMVQQGERAQRYGEELKTAAKASL